VSQPDLSNLSACTTDCLRAARSDDAGPGPPESYSAMMRGLAKARAKLPPLYRRAFVDPLVATLQDWGEAEFEQLVAAHSGADLFVFDFAQAVLQKGSGYRATATDAFQEVVSDLYDGFLGAEDRSHVKRPDRSVIPPLVKWGNPAWGPYTRPVDVAKEALGVEATIVSLPPAMARRGLLCWASLAHETAGHDILGADDGLPEELARVMRRALLAARAPGGLPAYWADRLEETASDVMGILNMGPAPAIALLALLRAYRGDARGPGRLLNDGRAADEHPADVLRGFLGAAVVRRLRFSDAAAWATAIETETMKDVAGITVLGRPLGVAAAKRSADVVAKAVMETPLDSLEHHALGEIQNWRDEDEAKVATLLTRLTAATPLPATFRPGVYAAHAVAAGVYAALRKGTSLSRTFGRMLAALQSMHDTNPAWGPLYVVHRGDVRPHPALDRLGGAKRRAGLSA
jgi:hypothetical protein